MNLKPFLNYAAVRFVSRTVATADSWVRKTPRNFRSLQSHATQNPPSNNVLNQPANLFVLTGIALSHLSSLARVCFARRYKHDRHRIVPHFKRPDARLHARTWNGTGTRRIKQADERLEHGNTQRDAWVGARDRKGGRSGEEACSALCAEIERVRWDSLFLLSCLSDLELANDVCFDRSI